MTSPSFPGGKPDMFIAGDSSEAKQQVAQICQDFGWDVVDLGGIVSSRYLEPLAMVWIVHYMRTKSGNHALKFLRK